MQYSLPIVLALACLAIPPIGRAQLVESFDDGDFVSDPPWSGDTDRWQIGTLSGPSLQSLGLAEADTIHLATANHAAFGKWEFTIAHRAVNLSSFNGIRIFLISDTPDPRRSAFGYYVQLGTNNSDALSLWRVDGSMQNRRVELGRSALPVAAGDSSTLRIVVDRDRFGRFEVFVDDVLVISASDSMYETSVFFALWIKHSAAGAESFLIDDIKIISKHDENVGPTPATGDVVINEILSEPLPGQSEFVELYNAGTQPFDLRQFRIRDARSSEIPISYETRLLQPNSFAVLAQDIAAVHLLPAGALVLTVTPWPSLNNGGDTIVLSAPSGGVDSVSYVGRIAEPGHSLERIDPKGPSDLYNFGASTAAAGSTPGRINSIYAVDDTPPAIRFVDQISPTTLEIYFSESVRLDEISPASIRHQGEITGILPLATGALRIELQGTPTDLSIVLEGLQDRKGNTSPVLTHPIAFLPVPGDLAINEILYEPLRDEFDGRPDQVEFVEIINQSDHLISATSLLRTRRADEDGDADTLWIGRSHTALEPGAFLVISGGDSTTVRNGFPDSLVDPRANFVEVSRLTLSNSGDRVGIHNRLGEVINEVSYAPDWHHPHVAETRGFSLERIDLEAPSSDGSNWTTSTAPGGGTPGAPNSVAYEREAPHAGIGISVDPSPFSPDGDGRDDAVIISYRLESSTSNIRVRIFDVDGFEVRTLVSAGLVSAEGHVVWEGRDGDDRPLRIGIYIVVLEAVDPVRGTSEQYKRPVVLARPF